MSLMLVLLNSLPSPETHLINLEVSDCLGTFNIALRTLLRKVKSLESEVDDGLAKGHIGEDLALHLQDQSYTIVMLLLK